MVTLKINKKRFKCPTSKEEITLHQYQQLMSDWDGKDLVKLLSILIGHDYKGLGDADDYELESSLWNVVHFVFNSEFYFDNSDMPKSIRVGNIDITIPTDLGNLSLEQAIHVRQRMQSVTDADESADLNQCMSFALAVYLQPEYDNGPFDMDRALILEDKLLQMPIVDLHPIGFFLLNRVLRYGNKHYITWSRLKYRVRKVWKTLLRWLMLQD